MCGKSTSPKTENTVPQIGTCVHFLSKLVASHLCRWVNTDIPEFVFLSGPTMEAEECHSIFAPFVSKLPLSSTIEQTRDTCFWESWQRCNHCKKEQVQILGISGCSEPDVHGASGKQWLHLIHSAFHNTSHNVHYYPHQSLLPTGLMKRVSALQSN